MGKKSKDNNLLTREQFRDYTLQRDSYSCVFCKSKVNIVVHHILDRKLYADGGYYLNNGASVCDEHHWECEKTELSVEDVRKACGITQVALPEGFDKDKIYDKWGNIILPDGRREPGVMFYEENVQKILKTKLWIFNF